ncbi:MAG: DUF4282 domain-containing protein [Nevskiales bacterium]|nr:DUF4282 domain-containing protein [Nevskiales bacterium]
MARQSFKLADLLGFRVMLAPYLIRFVYWAGALAIVGVGVQRAFRALVGGSDGGILGVLLAVAGAAVLLLIWRVLCELWMVAFGIHERLGELVAATRHAPSSEAD